MARQLSSKQEYNGASYFNGTEQNGTPCLFYTHYIGRHDTGPDYNTAPECDQNAIGFEEDKSGRFWGWDNVKQVSCVFRNAQRPSGGGSGATRNIDGKNYPICQNPGAASPADAYGRRWGWENNQSCVS
jgi:hypothetical protein